MVGQLVVILILMAILVGAIVFLHHFVTSRSSAPATASTSQPFVEGLRPTHFSADGHAAIDGNVSAGYR
jgi:hypothetical protein